MEPEQLKKGVPDELILLANAAGSHKRCICQNCISNYYDKQYSQSYESH